MPCLVFIRNHYDGWPHYEPSFAIQFCCLLKLQKSFGSHFCNVLQVRYFWFFLFSRFPTQSIELYLFQAVVTHDMTDVSYSFLAFWYWDTAALSRLSMIPTSWFISQCFHSEHFYNWLHSIHDDSAHNTAICEVKTSSRHRNIFQRETMNKGQRTDYASDVKDSGKIGRDTWTEVSWTQSTNIK